MKKKRCSKCKQYFPPTAEYFHRNRSIPGGLVYACKTCANDNQRAVRRAESDLGAVGVVADRLEAEAIQNNEIKHYEKGWFKVERAKDKDRRTEIIGELIQQTKDFIVLKDKKGIIESFLKVDFQTNDHKIERVK